MNSVTVLVTEPTAPEAPAAVIVTALRIQRLPRRTIRLYKAIHRIAIQRRHDGPGIPRHIEQN